MPDLVFIGHIGQFETYIKTHCVHSPVNDPGQPWTCIPTVPNPETGEDTVNRNDERYLSDDDLLYGYVHYTWHMLSIDS